MPRHGSFISCLKYPIRSQQLRALLISLVLATGASSVAAVVEEPVSNEREQSQLPALGISSTFGRWVDTVHLRYNPDGAHPDYADTHYMIELLQEAAGRWEAVSGIRFDIVLDQGQPTIPGEVPVFWEHAPDSGWAGRAGPHYGRYDEDRGYYQYAGGTVKLNSAISGSRSADRMLRTMTHELGHLIGLGHSENPMSMMYANPYNQIQFPTEDDIRAVQVLYGLPEKLEENRYVAMPLASETRVNSLLRGYSNQVLLKWPGSPFGGQIVSKVSDQTSDDLMIALEGFYLHSNTPVRMKVISPLGHVLVNQENVLSCHMVSECRRSFSLIDVSSVKKIPGSWQIVLTDNEEKVSNPELLYSTRFDVDTFVEFNRAPEARVTVLAAESPNSINVQIQADDYEGDNIEVVWHLPGPRVDRDGDRFLDNYVRETLGKNTLSAWQEVSFPGPGEYEFFVQVNDDAVRYGDGPLDGSGSGDGFQTLLKVAVTLPIRSDDDIHVTSSYVPRGASRWLSTLNGVRAGAHYELPYQLIGAINEDASRLYSCVRVLNNGSPDPSFSENLDVTFEIASLERGEIRLVASRDSNTVPGGDNSHARCSGEFEASTGIYKDIIRLGELVFETEFLLTNDVDLRFRLVAGDELRPMD